MAKVINPLGAAEAHGRFARSLIFQGRTVKHYASPKIKKVPAQLAAEARLRDVNKTLQALRGWGRGAMWTLFGSNWVAFGYQAIVSYWAESLAAYDALEASEKEAWFEYAPVKATLLDSGLVFYACAVGLRRYMTDGGYFNYEFFEVGEVNPPGSRAWWDKDLLGVFLPGVYDQTNPDFSGLDEFHGWSLVVDDYAYGGSYRLSTESSMDIFVFWFWGESFSVIYKQAAGLGALMMELDFGVVWTLYQNNPDEAYQAEWRSPSVARGLHRITAFRTGAAGRVNFDGLVVYGKGEIPASE